MARVWIQIAQIFYHNKIKNINEINLKIISNKIHVENKVNRNILGKNEWFSQNQQI